jgi:legumain
MVIYIEACESGSMFEKLDDNINVYAVTASNADESSWGTYCPPDDMVKGVEINSCLGDLFSVNWMEDADKSPPSKETLDQQFTRVKTLTTKSHVMRYGDLVFKNEPVGNFYGNLDLPSIEETSEGFFDILFNKAKLQVGLEQALPEETTTRHISTVNSRDAKLHYLYSLVQRRNSHKAQLDLSIEITKRMRVDHIFEAFKVATGVDKAFQAANGPVTPTNFDCLKQMMATYDHACGKMDDYSLQFVKYFMYACELSTFPMEKLTSHVKAACSH